MTWPCDSSSSRVALVASRWEDPVQVVLAGSQVASGKHAGIYLRPSDIGCQYSRSIYTAFGNLVVPRTRRRIGDGAFSVAAPRAWNRLPTDLKLLRSADLFRRDLKTFLFLSVYGQQVRIQIDSVMSPRSSSRRRNTSASVTVSYVFAVACTPHMHVVFSMFEATHMHDVYVCDECLHYDTCTPYMYLS